MAEKKKAGVKLGWNNLAARKKIMATKERKKRKRQRDLLKQKQDVKPKPLKKKEKPLSKRELHDLKVAPLLKSLKHQGMSFEKIAQNFNETGAVFTRQGGKWSAMQVFRIYKRLNGHMKIMGSKALATRGLVGCFRVRHFWEQTCLAGVAGQASLKQSIPVRLPVQVTMIVQVFISLIHGFELNGPDC